MTKYLQCYAPEEKPVVVYDTMGLEHGNHKEFVRETNSFLSCVRASKGNCLKLKILIGLYMFLL